MKPDLTFADHGSVCLLKANTDAGATWIEEHIPEDAMTWAGAIVVEPRYVDGIAAGAMGDGLTVA
jgi:hypothetical protein